MQKMDSINREIMAFSTRPVLLVRLLIEAISKNTRRLFVNWVLKNVPLIFVVFGFSCFAVVNETQAQSIEAELGFSISDNDSSSLVTLSPLFELVLPFSQDWALAAEWGFVFTDISSDEDSGDSTFCLGNPFIFGIYTIAEGAIDLSIGGGVGLPVASVSEGDPVDSLAYTIASGLRGNWDLWLFRADTMSIVFPLQLVLDDLPLLNLRGDAAAAFLISTSDYHEDDVGLLLQAGGEAGLDLGLAELGLRLQVVWVPTDEGDNAQTAVEPYLLLSPKPAFVRIGLLMNLDEPLGFAFDENGVWGLRLNAGLEF